MDWKLHAEGGYSKVYINDKKTEIKKVTPKYIEDGNINHNAMIDIALQRSFGCYIHGVPVISRYEIDDENVTIYMPYYGIPLNELDRKVPRPELASYVISRLCEILMALDKNGIQHTDLKPSNILWNSEANDITLIDYNIVSHIICSNQNKPIYSCAYGTWSYSAPEIVLHTKPVATSTSWAIGLLLAYMYGSYPWDYIYKLSQRQITSRTYWKQALVKLHSQYESCFPLSVRHVRNMPPEHVDLYRKCVSWNPDDRPSLSDIYTTLRGYENIRSEIPLISFTPTKSHMLSNDTIFIMITKIYNICRITKTLHVFIRSVEYFERSYTHTSPYTLFEQGCAAHCLTLLLLGNFVFNARSFVDTITVYWDIEENRIKEAVWYVAEQCDGWMLISKMADVVALENGTVTQNNYELWKNKLLQGYLRTRK